MHDNLSNNNSFSHDFALQGEQGFFDKSVVLRIIIASLLTLSLFLFLHFKEIHVETLELHSKADHYVVAQIDFTFFDEEATLLLKQEAANDIGTIYKVSDKDIRSQRLSFEKKLVEDGSWRDVLEDVTFESLYSITDILERELIALRFTDPRTRNEMHTVNVSTEKFYIFSLPKQEKKLPILNEIWDHITTSTFHTSEYPQYAIDFVLEYFKKIEWDFEKDLITQRVVRDNVKGQVAKKYTTIKAGERIIDHDENVTSRHISMLKAMKKSLNERHNLWHPLTLLGSFTMAMLFITLGGSFLWRYYTHILSSNKKVFLLSTVIIMSLALAKVTELSLLSTQINLTDIIRFPILVPFPAILLCSLMSSSLSVVVSVFLSVVMSISLVMPHKAFLIINLLPAIVATLNIRSLRKRKEVFSICLKSWACSALIIIAVHLYDNTIASWAPLVDLSTTLFFMVATGVLVIGILPIMEALFNMITDVTLMEYLDPNNPILRRLALEAPGTYQHSIVVGNLAEAAAVSIGANGLFCKVTTQYHDIGKLATPHYFSENQQKDVNIHQLLTPLESTQVIISHVSEGVALARKENLPEQFIDIIKEHHGTTLVSFFYHKHLELKEEGEEGESSLDEYDFRYMGPRPHSREAAIIMIADSFEAASRSLDEVTEESLSALADAIVQEKADDSQFNECNLSFKELISVKKAMVKTLTAVSHSRVKYPKMKGKGGASPSRS
jgi:cyclic-di-AMP phosphodiesterase PgpH